MNLALRTTSLGCVLALVTVSQQAAAQEAAPPSEPAADAAPTESAPKIHLVSQEPSTTQRTYHMHDGFYLRGSFGFGSYLGGLTTTLEDNRTKIDLSGNGIGFDLLVGGSPSPGFAVGGGVISNLMFDAKYKGDARTDTSNTTALLAGVFVDGYPRPAGPWHVGGMVGLAHLSLEADSLVNSTLGIGGAVFGGYDAWVADDVAVGGLLRLTLARTSGSDDDLDMTGAAGALTLMFTAVYN